MKKRNLLFITFILVLLLAACGDGTAGDTTTPQKKDESIQNTTAEEAEISNNAASQKKEDSAANATTVEKAEINIESTEPQTEDAKIELSDDDCFDIVFSDAPTDSLTADNCTIERKKDGTIIFTFTTVDGEYSYKLDAYTGEILEKSQPETITTSKNDHVDDDIFDILKEICPVDYAQGENLKIRKSDDNSSFEVSFNTSDGYFFYRIDRETGEVIEKQEPENITEKSKVIKENADDKDPFSIATDACCKYANVNPWEAEGIHIKEISANKLYEVTFSYNGADYDLIYDFTTGEVTSN